MDLAISPEILALLVCPVSGQRLRLATAGELLLFTLGEEDGGALLTEDLSVAYPVRDGFPILVESERLERQSKP